MKILATIAAANRMLTEFAKEIGSRHEVKEVTQWPFTCRSYPDAMCVEGNVVTELHDGNALDFGVEISSDDDRWIIQSSVHVQHDQGQDLLREFPTRYADTLDNCVAGFTTVVSALFAIPTFIDAVQQEQERSKQLGNQRTEPTGQAERKQPFTITKKEASRVEKRTRPESLILEERMSITMPSRDQTFIVRGQVRHADGRLLSGLRVRAYDKDLRTEEPLGEAFTDDEGNYEISYTTEQFRRAEKQSADLIVRVLDGRVADREEVLAESPLIFNGGRATKGTSNGLLKKANGNSKSAVTIETVNLVVEREEYRGASEYERYIADINPLLLDGQSKDLPIAELKEQEQGQDVAFIAGETGIDRMHIIFLILSARHAPKTGLPPEAFYGMFRQGLPTNLSALLMQPPRRHREALEKSLRDNLIPSALSHDLDRILKALPQLIGKHVLKERDEGTFVLGDLLNAGDVPVDIQEKFLRRHLEHEGPIEEFWKSLAEDPAFATKGVIDDLHLTLHLGSLTQNNVPLIKALHGLRRKGTLQSLRDLTKLEAQDWKELIAASVNGHGPSIPLSVPGSTDEDRIANYVNDIIETLKDTFPTVYISRGLAAEPDLGDLSLVNKLLGQNPKHDPVDPVADDFNWEGIKTTDRERAKASLNALRRELKMFPGMSRDTLFTHEAAPGAKTRSGTLRNPIRKEVTEFLDQASDLDLRETHIDSYLAGGGKKAFAGVTNKEAVTMQLKQLQRVFRIAPRYEHMEALVTEGYHSAFSIASTPPKNFMQQMATKLGGTASAQAYYVKAQRRAAETTRAAATAYDLFNGVSTMVTRITEDQKKTMPTWAKLFGSPDLCECQHCRSVYGPAAYFVDLLQFLRKSGEQPFTILNGRRPDLQYIKLTCENTNTPLPYVDLVNEILESYVALGTGKLDKSTAKNTVNITAEELSVNPQYTNEAAYQKLKLAVHTFQLPFNRPVEVARAYLEHLGSSRYEVMALFQNDGTKKKPQKAPKPNVAPIKELQISPGGTQGPQDLFTQEDKKPSKLDVACEYLKITTEEREILTGASTKPAYQFFGYTNASTWRSSLAHVPEFLRRTGVTYLDLVELLKTRYINAELTGQAVDHQSNASTGIGGTQSRQLQEDSSQGRQRLQEAIAETDDHELNFSPKTIVLYAPDSVCDLSRTRIRHLDGTQLEQGEWLKMHRFLRLWRKLDWKMQELDKAMKALDVTDIDDGFLEDLADLKWLQSALNLPVVKLLSMWAPIDTFGDDALYLKLFQNKAVINPVDLVFQLRHDDSSRLNLTEAKISEHIPAILAALRISDEDLGVIREATDLADPEVLLTLEDLSALYRHALLAKALKLKLKDFISLKLLTGINPFLPGKLAETVKFVKKARSIKESGFSIAHLNYLFRPDPDRDKNIAPREEAVMLLLNTLQADLNKILDETVVLPDPTGELLRSKLSLVIDSTLVDGVMGLIDGTSTMDNKPEFIRQHFQLFLKQEDIEEAVLLLEASNITQEQREANIRYLLPRLMTHLRDSLSRSLVKQSISESLELDGELAKALLEIILTAKTDPAKTAMADFLALVGDGLSVSHFTDANLGTVQHWTGLIIPQHDDSYSFYTRLKGGVRVWVNDEILINQWVAQDKILEHISEKQIPLKAGQAYRIRLEYFTNDPETVTELRWSSVSTPKNIVPQSQLYSSDSFPIEGIRQAYLRLHKIALLANTFKMTAEEAIYLSEHSEDFEDFDFNSVPTDSSAQNVMDGIAVKFFEQWEKLHEYFTLRTSLPQHALSLLDVFTAANFPQPPNDPIFSSAVPPTLAKLTAWPLADIQYLFSPDALDLSVDAFKNASGPTKLWEVFTLSRKLGVSVQQLRDWAVKRPNTTQANAIVQAVKAKYDDDQWLVIAKPLNDNLREKQKAALIAYVLADKAIVEKGITDSNQLFEYFLIDVNMSSCFMTSRIKQGISSVQLFVQRCLMNLEPDVSADLLDSDWWKWMKNYRVWEANRKVFLYPENWIEPELRDDKSPFFKELETELLQNEVMENTVEQALLNYLEKLDDVARLDICGMYWQERIATHPTLWMGANHLPPAASFAAVMELQAKLNAAGANPSVIVTGTFDPQTYTAVIAFQQKHGLKADGVVGPETWAVLDPEENDETDILHVFGRTSDPPHIYYYRQYLANIKVWTPWEKVNVDIEGDHLLPIVYNRRLYLFWVRFEEKPDKEHTLSGPYVQSEEHWRWISEYKDWKIEHNKWRIRHAHWETIKSIFESWKSINATLKENQIAIDQLLLDLEDHYGEKLEEEPPEPREPTEPAYSTPPPLTRWEIKLSWSEQKDKKWTAKQSSAEAVVSPAIQVDMVDFLASNHPEGNWDEYLGLAETRLGTMYTIVDVYLPEKSTHFFRTKKQDNDLVIDVYRRYSHHYRVLEEDAKEPLKGYEYVGNFRMHCGSKVDIASSLQGKIFTSLAMPDDATNLFMTFQHQIGTKALSFTADGKSLEILKRIPEAAGEYNVLPEHQRQQFMLKPPFHPFFYQDRLRTYYVTYLVSQIGHSLQSTPHLKFDTFFHPHMCTLINALNSKGISGILTLRNQRLTHDKESQTVFFEQYSPAAIVHKDHPREDVDFKGGAYSLYNWELFFHVPLLVADRLSKNQQFEAAQKWFHYIFDPLDSHTDELSPARYWKVLPFYQNKDIVRLDKWLESVSVEEVEAWRDNPFSPHLVARSRLVSYQKTVVMKYIDNLIAWGDQLFSRDTIESINEATQLYIMAYNILGLRPQEIPQRGKVKEQTYLGLVKAGLDAFSNAPAVLENELPFNSNDEELISKKFSRNYFQGFPQVQLGDISGTKNNGDESAEATKQKLQVSDARPSLHGHGNSAANGGLGFATTFYFCIPQNDKLLGYWDTVEDRLFKIRHCMNIEGIVRELPLFEPPIDPALLVRATAMGLDLNSVLNDVNSPLPPYRFSYLLQKAVELCAEVKTLGGSLLSALEKKDSESLALLRAFQEKNMLMAVKDTKSMQVEEANEGLEGLKKSKLLTTVRRDYYRDIVKISAKEQEHMDRLDDAHVFSEIAQGMSVGVALSHMIPDFHNGVAGFSSPFVVSKWGGNNLGNALQAAAGVLNMIAAIHTHKGTMASIQSGYERRWDDWKLQEKLANNELDQIDRQIAAGEIRLAMAEKDVENHDKQIADAAAVEEFLRNKYTNEELYGWMLTQISAVFFQSYKLAYDMAKRAEKTYRFERGLTSSNFIQFGYWDSLRKGLLSGERLHLDLKRMEMAYMDQNKREYEITKQISLVLHEPLRLIELKETGKCVVELPETLFDMDYPGHYMRRIKNVSLTIPCVVGPYTSVNCTLTLLKNEVRIDANAQQDYAKDTEGEDPRFITNFGALQSIATSHGQNDAGMFELNFRDERYLPFEGAGVISRWRIDLPKECNAFDFDTISDVIIKLNYTAREGGEVLKTKALKALSEPSDTEDGGSKARLFSMRHEFPTEWHRFLHPGQTDLNQALVFVVTPERFPFQLRGRAIDTTNVEVFLKATDGVEIDGTLTMTLTAPDDEDTVDLINDTSYNGLLHDAQVPIASNIFGTWTLTANETDILQAPSGLRKSIEVDGTTHQRLNPDAIQDLLMVFHFDATAPPS